MQCINNKHGNTNNNFQSGDIIAFSSDTWLSGVIQRLTGSAVSHVGIVLKEPSLTNEDTIVIFESTTDSCFRALLCAIGMKTACAGGVRRTEIKKRIGDYSGCVWWLPLNKHSREKLDVQCLTDFLHKHKNKPYCLWEAINSALDNIPLLSQWFHNEEDHEKFFCSELVAAALKSSRVLPAINSSELMPHDICKRKIFKSAYYYLRGEGKTIGDYNSVDLNDHNTQMSEQSYPANHPRSAARSICSDI